MKNALTLAAAVFVLALSAHSASAQRSGGGGGTIGCDPSNAGSVRATNCSVFFKEALYGPSANPYASAWDNGHAAKPVVKRKKVTTSKTRKTSKSSASGSTAN